MNPTDVLKREHRHIEPVLECLAAAATAIEGGESCGDSIRKGIRFLREYADGVHHRKEEEQLFPLLEERGIAREGGPIGVMLMEHDEGRALIAAMEKALDESEAGDLLGATRLSEAVTTYGELLREHIMKEDEVLFPMGDGVMSDDDQDRLRVGFQGEDQAHVAELEELARSLCEEWKIPFPDSTLAGRS